MFETSRPQTRGRRLFYELLPVSLAVHAAVATALLIAAVWNVTFPTASPKLYLAFQISAPPPPPPPPPPPAAARPQPTTPNVRPPDEIVAPTIIPDVIPVVENEPPPRVEIVEGAVEGGVEGGIEGGVVGGIIGGVLGGVLDDGPPPPPPDGRIHIPRDKPLRMPVLSQLYPIYPSVAVRQGWEDTLVVRYVIGKDGRVKEVTIIQPPSRKEFEKPTISAIRMWRFRPMREDGEAKEVVHELTVNYRLMPNS
jgi:protein TonB